MSLLKGILGRRRSALIFAAVFVIHIVSSFDICWFLADGGEWRHLRGFVFSSTWREHLHSSEEWAVYYQVQALREGRVWLGRGSPPKVSTDVFQIGEYYYAPFEPLAALALFPYHLVGEAFSGEEFRIRSLVIGMIFYTCLNALLVRRISSQVGQSRITADLSALLYGLATMAFSYSRLLYPQPIAAMFMLLTVVFLFNYRRSRVPRDLFLVSLFCGLAVSSFNASIIAMPLILYYLMKGGAFSRKEHFLTAALGLLPSIALFASWNYLVTGNPLTTPRQVVHPSVGFELVHITADATWLNVEGLLGSLISPLGIFFVSPILPVSFAGFLSLKSKAKDEAMLLSALATFFWLFMSLLNLGGQAGRDFWVGGWANIARHMYLSSSLLVILASEAFEFISKSRHILGAWLISLASAISLLANFSYGVRHDLMVGHLKDYVSNSLLIWPYPLDERELGVLLIIVFSLSLVYPILLARRRGPLRAPVPSRAPDS